MEQAVFGLLSGLSARPREGQLLASMIKAGAPLCVPPDKADALPKPMHLAVCDAERAKEAAR